MSQVLEKLDRGAVNGVDCGIWAVAEAVAAGVEPRCCGGGPCCSPSFLWLYNYPGVLELEEDGKEGKHLELEPLKEPLV